MDIVMPQMYRFAAPVITHWSQAAATTQKVAGAYDGIDTPAIQVPLRPPIVAFLQPKVGTGHSRS